MSTDFFLGFMLGFIAATVSCFLIVRYQVKKLIKKIKEFRKNLK